MTADQLDEISRRLGVVLPEAYRDFALAWGSRPVPILLHGEHDWYLDDPEEVIRETLRGRDEVAGWRPPFVSIGDDQGERLVLDTEADHAPVLYVSHETDQLMPGWVSFPSFTLDMLEALGRGRAAFEQDQARARAEQDARMWRGLRIMAIGLVVLIVVPLLILGAIVWGNERRWKAEAEAKAKAKARAKRVPGNPRGERSAGPRGMVPGEIAEPTGSPETISGEPGELIDLIAATPDVP